IRIPGKAVYQYFFNLSDSSQDEEEEDLIVLEEGAIELDLRPLVYESIILSLPMINVYDCENDDQAPCDRKVLEILHDKKNEEEVSTDPLWDVLKDIKFEE